MMRQIILCFALSLLTACAAAPPRPTPGISTATKPHKPVPPPAQPMPIFELQHNWRIVETDGVDSETLAVVTLARPELAGLMRLEIMASSGMTPRQFAAMVRERVDSLEGTSTLEPRGPDTDDAAGFIWMSDDADPTEGRTIGHVIIRRIPDRADRLAFCEGWWPETSDTFLFSPLLNSCVSVRLPPWSDKRP